MTPAQLRAALSELGLTPDTAAPVLGVTTRAIYRYLDGTRRIPKTLELLIRALRHS